MARIYAFGSVTGTATNNTTTYNTYTGATATISTTTGKSYAIFWAAVLSHNSNTSDCRARLQNITAGTQLQLFNIEPSDNTVDRISVHGAAVYFAATGGSTQFGIQFSAEAGTTTISDGYIFVLELSDIEATYYSTTLGNTATSANTYSTLQTAPLPAGNWIVIGSMGVDTSVNTQADNDYGMRLYDDTNAVTLAERNNIYLKDNSNYTPYYAAAEITTTGNPTTIVLQHRSNGAASFDARERSLIILNKDDFAATFTSFDNVGSTTTSTTPQAEISFTPTIANTGNHLVLGFWTTEINSTTQTVYSHFGTSTTEPGQYSAGRQPRRDSSDAADDEFSHGWVNQENLTAGSVTVSVKCGWNNCNK
jgi:hypothetical protein